MADCQSFNTDGKTGIMNKDGVFYISADMITWREATEEEIDEYEKKQTEYKERVSNALKKEIDTTSKDGIRSIIKILEKDINRYSFMLNTLNGTSKEYPYRCFGIKTLEEAIAYLSDTVDSLKNVIKEEV